MFYLGTSGWYYDHWKGLFYPEKIEKKDWLPYYSKKFNTVEVNASFYRLPFKNMVKGWYNKTPDNFLLTFKGSRIVTHRKKLKNVEDYLEKFYSRIQLSKEKLAVVLWQLPPFLKRNDEKLKNFLSILNKEIKQVVEFRHPSWFTKEVYKILKKYDIGFCVVSCPDFSTPVISTTDFAYIRWHGKDKWYRSNYSKKDLKKWASKIKKLDVDEVYGYFNNDYNAYAPKNCLQLKEMLK
ncbi:MAG: DUF72 domain-containing protein [Candidatus Thermoplasmatota archaeon]